MLTHLLLFLLKVNLLGSSRLGGSNRVLLGQVKSMSLLYRVSIIFSIAPTPPPEEPQQKRLRVRQHSNVNSARDTRSLLSVPALFPGLFHVVMRAIIGCGGGLQCTEWRHQKVLSVSEVERIR